MAIPRWAGRGASAVVLVLIAIGITASVGRVVIPADMIQRAEPARTAVLKAFNRQDPLTLQRPAELASMDRPFAEHRFLTLVHVVSGGLFFMFVPLQFLRRLRARQPTVHRYSGRILLTMLTISLMPGLFFGLVMPFGGGLEAVMLGTLGISLLYAMAMAVIAIRRGDMARPIDFVLTP